MRKIALSLFICMCFASMARAQTGTIVLTVTSTPINIVTNQKCNYVVIEENSPTPANPFTITLPGQATGIVYQSGTKFVFSAGPNGFNSGQTLGTISVSSGSVSFIGIESLETPTLPSNGRVAGGGGGGGGTNPPDLWSGATSYVIGDIISYGGSVFTSIVNANLNNQPDANPSDWQKSSSITGSNGDVIGLSSPLITKATDNFNRAGPGLGANWTTVSGTTAPTITSNQVVGNAAVTIQQAFYSGSGAPDCSMAAGCWSQAVVPTGGNDPNGVVGVTTMVSGTSMYVFDFANGVFRLRPIVSGNGTVLGTNPGTVANGDTLLLTAQVVGGVAHLEGFKNGTLVVAANSSLLLTGNTGILVYGNVSVSKLDNFSTGTFATPSAISDSGISISNLPPTLGPDPWYDVTNPVFGCVGDGATDDTACIQKAINAQVGGGTGGSVYFPCGKTFLFGALDLSQGAANNKAWTVLNFCGTPKPTHTIELSHSFYAITGTGAATFNITAQDQVFFTGFDLTAFPNDGSPVILVDDAAGTILFSHIGLLNAPAVGLQLGAHTATGPANITVEDSVFSQAGNTGACIDSYVGFGLYLTRLACEGSLTGANTGIVSHGTGFIEAKNLFLGRRGIYLDGPALTGVIGTDHFQEIYTENMIDSALFTIHTNGYGAEEMNFGPDIHMADNAGGGLYVVNHTGDASVVKVTVYDVSAFTGYGTSVLNGTNIQSVVDGESGISMSAGATLNIQSSSNIIGCGSTTTASLTVTQCQAQNPALVVQEDTNGAQSAPLGQFEIRSVGGTARYRWYDKTDIGGDFGMDLFGGNILEAAAATAKQVNLVEGTAPSGISLNSVFYGLTANHWPAFNPNNSGARAVCGSTGSFTSGHIVASNATGTTCDLVDGGTGTGSGTVTAFSAANITTASQNFATQAVTSPGVTPNLTFTLANAPAHKIFMNNTGGAAAPDYQSIGEADMPGATVFTDQNATFGAHNYLFTAATQFRVRASAGLTTAADGDFGLDTTNHNFHGWNNGADLLMPEVPIGTAVNGHCPTYVVAAGNVRFGDAVCGAGGGNTQTNGVNNATPGGVNFANTTGASGITWTNPGTTTENAVIANTVGLGNAVVTATITGARQGDYPQFNATPALVNATPGVPVNAQTGTSYTVLTGDRGKLITQSNAAASAYTLPQANSTGFDSNWFACFQNNGAGSETITPTTSTINGLASLTLLSHQSACINSDNTNYFARVTGDVTYGNGVLDQVAVSTANSGVAQNVLASVPVTGRYNVNFYIGKSASCSTGGALTATIGWQDANGPQSADDVTGMPTNPWGANSMPVWAVSGSAITITYTYTACSTGGPWTYDGHAWVTAQ